MGFFGSGVAHPATSKAKGKNTANKSTWRNISVPLFRVAQAILTDSIDESVQAQSTFRGTPNCRCLQLPVTVTLHLH